MRKPPNKPSGNRSQGPRRSTNDQVSLGGSLVIGRRSVRELLKAKSRKVRDLWIVEDLDSAAIMQEIEERARESRVNIRYVGRQQLEQEAKTDGAQGVIAHVDPLREYDIEKLVQKTGEQPPFLLVLDGVTDPHNLGALLRTAESAGVTGVVIGRHRAAHITPTVTKAAAGAIEHLRLSLVTGIPSALETLKKAGVWTVGLDSDAKEPLFDLTLADQPIAIVVGAEGDGMSQLTKKRCELLVSIPQAGSVESLNVSAAGALAMFEVARGRG